MEEPKTLEDFDFDNYGTCYADDSDGEGIKKVLRQAAIKWIKADIKVAQNQQMGVDSKMLTQCMRWANRFNISAKDLE